MLVLVGGALQKLFAVAHLLLRQEKENKLSFYLFLIAKVLLRSKYRPLFGLLVWGGLGLRGFITEMDRNDGSITEIFFLLGVLDWALGGCLYGLEKHYRNISCFARNLGSGLGRLSGSGLSGAGYYRNGQKLQKHYRNFLSTWGVLDWALGGCLFGSWRSLVLVGGALQKLFAVAHLLLRQEKENKLSFYLFLIAKVFLASLEIWGFAWVACLGGRGLGSVLGDRGWAVFIHLSVFFITFVTFRWATHWGGDYVGRCELNH